MEAFRKAFHGRYSAALIADVAYRTGARLGVVGAGLHPIHPRLKIAGPARTVEANNDLVAILLAVHRAGNGDVVVVANRENLAGLMGDIIATESKRGGLEGIVVDGLVRDTADLIEIGLPIFSRGCIPIGPLKLPHEKKGIGVLDVSVQIGLATVEPGQWIIGDADGVLVLNESDLPAVYDAAELALEKESRLVAAIKEGKSLGDVFGIESFVLKREENPAADFHEHLAGMDSAI